MSTAKPILTQGLEWVFAVVGVVAFYVFCFLWHDIFLFLCFLWRTFLWFCFLWHISFLVLFSVAGFFFLFLIYLSGLWPFSFVFSRTANNSILYFRGLGPDLVLDLVLGPDPVSVFFSLSKVFSEVLYQTQKTSLFSDDVFHSAAAHLASSSRRL